MPAGLGEVAVAEQGPVEIQVVGPELARRLRLAAGDVAADAERQMLRRDAMTVARQARRVVADDVLAQAAGTQPRRDRDVVPGRELDRLLAGDDRHPDRRVRPLHRARPHRDVLVRPELALIGEHLLGPGARDDVVGLLEARARLGQRHIVNLVLARDAAREARDQPAVRQAVEHRQLLGKPQRLVQRQQIAVDQQFQLLGALRGGRRHQVGRIHQPIGRAMMLVEADPVIAQAVHLFPGIEMLGVRTDRHVRLEMPLAQGIGQLRARLQMVEVLAVGQKVEDKDFHGTPRSNGDACRRQRQAGDVDPAAEDAAAVLRRPAA